MTISTHTPNDAPTAPTELEIIASIADIHARFREKLQQSSRRATGDQDLATAIRGAKALELAALEERASLLEKAKADATERFDAARIAVADRIDSLRSEIAEFKNSPLPARAESDDETPLLWPSASDRVAFSDEQGEEGEDEAESY